MFLSLQRFAVTLLLFLVTPLMLSADEKPAQKEAKPEVYTYKKDHDPNGIGKFYMGREIAHVMSFHGINWLERANREEEERLSLMIKALQLKPGIVVADIGAGAGVISMPMAFKVAPKGKVMAVDIQQEMLDRLKKKAEANGVKNIVPVKGTEKATGLKPGTVDVALFVDVYHEFKYPLEMMIDISRAMKPGGRIILVEYRLEDRRVPIKLIHKMTEAQVKKELTRPELNLKWKETIGVLPRQHIVIFEKQKPKEKK